MSRVNDQAPASEAVSWAQSGAMALTGDPYGPPRLTPWPIARGMESAAVRFGELSGRLGRRVEIDGPALLGERAALAGFGRQGGVSVGGGGRMVRTADGWIVLQLARDSDWYAVPALTGGVGGLDDWTGIERMLADQPTLQILETAWLLGLAAAECAHATGPIPLPVPVRQRTGGTTDGRRITEGLRVVDLSALWAGPLCAQLLGLAGANVTKVEDPRRPDGARRGARQFYDLLHSRHGNVEIDFTSAGGRDELRRLLSGADVVIESSRPRVMEQLGIDPETIADGPLTWLSITAYDRAGPLSNAIGFGDDAAVAAGAWLPGEGPHGRPHFIADALADPATGLAAAVAVLEAVEGGGGQWIEMSLHETVRRMLAGAGLRVTQTDTADTDTVDGDGNARVEHGSDGHWRVVTDKLSVPVARPRARRP